MKVRHGIVAYVLLVLMAASLKGQAGAQAFERKPNADTLLRRADLARNPYLGTAIDIRLTATTRESGAVLRRSRFTMLTHRADRTLLLLWQEQETAPGALLVADDRYWLLLPQAQQAVKLAFRHVVAGDLSHAGFLRFNLRLRYEPHHDGVERLDGKICWRLRLTPKSPSDPFSAVRYWIAQESGLPIRLDFYGDSGALLKTARFVRFQPSRAGLRPERIEIEDAFRPHEKILLVLDKPQSVATSSLPFDLEDLRTLRDAARNIDTETGSIIDGGSLVKALTNSTRGQLAHP